jgi:hypothetical protein
MHTELQQVWQQCEGAFDATFFSGGMLGPKRVGLRGELQVSCSHYLIHPGCSPWVCSVNGLDSTTI